MDKELVHIEIKKKQNCSQCSGNGEIPLEAFTYICGGCNGTGFVMVGRTIDLLTLKGMLDGK